MRVVLLTLLLSLALGACVNAPYKTPIVHGDSEVAIEIQETATNWVLLEFTVDDRAQYTHIVQEIYLPTGEVLVECFRLEGYIWDRHSWPGDKHSRSMVMYLAIVEGADERHGFAHLPDNGQGVETTVGPDFNRSYQLDYKTQGKITERSPHRLYWSIHDNGPKVTVAFSE